MRKTRRRPERPRETQGTYDPDVAPDARAWLTQNEALRLIAIENYHRETEARLPNLRAHSAIHAVVENQLAEGLKPVTRALKRLMAEGLDRHEAVHAIGSVVAARIYTILKTKKGDTGEYLREVEELTAAKWRSDFGS